MLCTVFITDPVIYSAAVLSVVGAVLLLTVACVSFVVVLVRKKHHSKRRCTGRCLGKGSLIQRPSKGLGTRLREGVGGKGGRNGWRNGEMKG